MANRTESDYQTQDEKQTNRNGGNFCFEKNSLFLFI
jgi:hypothetical protein